MHCRRDHGSTGAPPSQIYMQFLKWSLGPTFPNAIRKGHHPSVAQLYPRPTCNMFSKPELAFFAGIIVGIGPRKLTMRKGSYLYDTFCSWLHSLLPNKRCADFREKRIGHDRP